MEGWNLRWCATVDVEVSEFTNMITPVTIYRLHRKNISVHHNHVNVILLEKGQKGTVEINIFADHLIKLISLKIKDNQEMKEAAVCWTFSFFEKTKLFILLHFTGVLENTNFLISLQNGCHGYYWNLFPQQSSKMKCYHLHVLLCGKMNNRVPKTRLKNVQKIKNGVHFTQWGNELYKMLSSGRTIYSMEKGIHEEMRWCNLSCFTMHTCRGDNFSDRAFYWQSNLLEFFW